MILIVDNESKHISDIKKYLKLRSIKYKVATKRSSLKTIMKHRYSGVILSGGHLCYDSKIDIDDVDIDLAILLDLDVPILGICFGHQTIVEAFHGKVRRIKSRVHGLEKITILKKNALFSGLPKEVEMHESHFDCANKLPYNFEITARSRKCGIEAIKHKKKKIYGVQFHPELSGEIGYKVLDNFMRLCKIKV